MVEMTDFDGPTTGNQTVSCRPSCSLSLHMNVGQVSTIQPEPANVGFVRDG